MLEDRYKHLMIKTYKEDQVLWLYLNRPEALNALNREMRLELKDILSNISCNKSIRVVVITGAGKAFCAGGDLKSMGRQLGSLVETRENIDLLQGIILSLTRLPQVVIAAVNGPAVGAGCNLALACDLVIASEKAKFGQVFVKIGLIPDAGGTYLLPRLVGIKKAKELMFSGEMITANEAMVMGLVNRVVPDSELFKVVEEWAFRFAKGPAQALQLCKWLINRGSSSNLEDALERETLAQMISLQSEDHKEGVGAFQEKREPQFKKII